MARAKVVIADQRSAEFDELRKTVHTILLLLENFSTAANVSLADATAIAAALRTLGDAVANGVTPSTHVTAPSRPVLGVVPKVRARTLPRDSSTVKLEPSDKSY